MNLNESETKKILDEGMLTRSLIENDVATRKCYHYSDIASDPTIKAFFKDQAKALEDVTGYIKSGMASLK